MRAVRLRPVSPHGLIQEFLAQGPLYPWRMLVACQLLNRTGGAVAIPCALEVLRRWPTPEALALSNTNALRAEVRRCGLWRRRARNLQEMSLLWFWGWRNPAALPGVGRYALDSWAIFVEGRLPRSADDGKLKLYLKWARRVA